MGDLQARHQLHEREGSILSRSAVGNLAAGEQDDVVVGHDPIMALSFLRRVGDEAVMA